MFGIRPEHVSRIFQHAKAKGSAGLVKEMDRPRLLDASGVARALGLLCNQLNATAPHISGDRRPITYQIVARS